MSAASGSWLWRRVAPTNVVGVLAMCSAFGIVIAAGLYFSREPVGAFRTPSLSGAGGLAGAVKAVPLVGAAALGPDDPVVRFADTGVGQVLYANTNNDNCVRVLFDNRTGAYYDAEEVFCGQSPDQVAEAETPERLNALRKSFQK